jgi:ParB/RepB/Spo0J family partition protein
MPGTGDRYPDSFDELADISELKRGKHNVRNATPSEHLENSIQMEGMKRPLTVRDAADDEKLHITDGWQRYQAAVSLGWGKVPVNIHADTLSALRSADAVSISDEWTKYNTAQHCQSLRGELENRGVPQEKLARRVSEETSRSLRSVRRYLNAMELPDVLHPLLKESSNVSEREWTQLQNYTSDTNLRQYSFSWDVAAKAGNHIDKFDDEVKLIKAVVAAAEYNATDGSAFLQELIEDPTMTIKMARHSVCEGVTPTEKRRYRVPSLEVRMPPEQKKMVIDHLAEQKMFIRDKVRELFKEWAEDLEDKNTSLTDYEPAQDD